MLKNRALTCWYISCVYVWVRRVNEMTEAGLFIAVIGLNVILIEVLIGILINR